MLYVFLVESNGVAWRMCGGFEQYIRRMRLCVGNIPLWRDESEIEYNLRPTMMVGTIDAEGYKAQGWSLTLSGPRNQSSGSPSSMQRADPSRKEHHTWGLVRLPALPIPSSAYFEWTGKRGAKQCHAVEPESGHGLCFGGLWETWSCGENVHHSCTIVTVAAHESIQWQHHRMPLMLSRERLRSGCRVRQRRLEN